jgi:hypothetical protein
MRNLVAAIARALPIGKAFALFMIGSSKRVNRRDMLIGGYMITETELFYLAVLAFLVLIINFVISVTEPRRRDRSHG